MDEYIKKMEAQLESLKAHVEDMSEADGDVWSDDSEALKFSIDVVSDLRKGYKLCKVNEVLEVIGQLAWKNHSKYGADVVELNDIVKVIQDGCKLGD
jgi:hypothetical protein